jgi:choline kinase
MISPEKEKFYRAFIMQIDYALILSAGLGTRMGEIGKNLPKVLWPILETPLLELQVRYCELLGIKKIYINTHFLHQHIETFVQSKKWNVEIFLLHEKLLLDSGGAIHNMASRPEINYSGNVLLLNADQFLFFEEHYWEQALSELSDSRAVLFGIEVDKASAYNETVCENKRLVNIQKNIDKNRDYVTYSGLGLLKLDGLKAVPGISKFFETVANYREEKVKMLPVASAEYWDFGTAEIYASNMFRLFYEEKVQSKFVEFLKRNNVICSPNQNFISREKKSINLDRQGIFQEGALVFGSIVQKIKP